MQSLPVPSSLDAKLRVAAIILIAIVVLVLSLIDTFSDNPHQATNTTSDSATLTQ